MKKNVVLIVGIGAIVLFWLFIFKFFPLGFFLTVIGAVMATHVRTRERNIRLLGAILSWLYPIGVIYTFVHDGFLWGIIAIIVGFLFYKFAK